MSWLCVKCHTDRCEIKKKVPPALAIWYHCCLVIAWTVCRPDMTFTVDWALNNNYVSIWTVCSSYFSGSEKMDRSQADVFMIMGAGEVRSYGLKQSTLCDFEHSLSWTCTITVRSSCTCGGLFSPVCKVMQIGQCLCNCCRRHTDSCITGLGGNKMQRKPHEVMCGIHILLLTDLSCCSVPQLNSLRVTRYMHPHLYMYKYSYTAQGERIACTAVFSYPAM